MKGLGSIVFYTATNKFNAVINGASTKINNAVF
jgi:hypothetical protein